MNGNECRPHNAKHDGAVDDLKESRIKKNSTGLKHIYISK